MKKVLSFVLVLSMILGSFGMAFAAPATDVAGSKYENAVNMLTELDVISGYTDGTFKPGKEVTRAEMATFIIKALNLDEYATAGSSFTDMEGHWADGFVGYAASLQIVAGRTATTFDPDATVTYDEAITMIVQALGYQGKYMVGGFPGAFVNKAKALGLLDGVVAGKANAVRGDIALLIYNALNKNFVQYDVEGAEKTISPADNMMKRLTGATTTFGGVVAGNEEALIAIKEYQGAEVKGLKNSDGKIVAIEEVVSIFLEGDINASGTALTLADDTEYKLDRVKTSDAAYFVNGVKDSDNKNATELTGKAVKMAVKVSGKYVTDVYSYAEWTAAGTFKWAEADAEALEKDAPKLKNVAFVMTDNDEIDTKEFVLEGAASLDAIPEDAIVTYYVANLDEVAGNEIAKVEVSTTVVEGKVSEITKAGKLVIGGKEYKKATGTSTVETINDGLGAEGKFYLNAAGNIAYTDTTAKAADDYAIVLLAAKNDNGGYDAEDNFKIKLLTADGKAQVFAVTKKCFNEKASDSAVFTKGAVVAYALDADGAVKDIVAKNASMAGFGSYKLSAKNYLNGFKVSSNVVVFQPDTDKDYVVGEMSDIAVDEALVKTKYLLNGDKEVVVIYTEDTDKEDGIYGMVVGYSQVQNADEKNVYKVTLAIDGKVQEPVLTTEDFTTNAAFEGTSLCAFSYENGELKAVAATTGATSLKAGTIEKIQDGNVTFTTDGAFDAVAEDVVVYLVEKDGDVVVSSFTALTKGDAIELYQLDKSADDKDGYDIIIVREK